MTSYYHRARRRLAFVSLLFLLVPTLVTALTSCAAVEGSAPSCQGVQRLALVAQSVPSASFVPCVQQLPAGWAVPTLRVQRGVTDFSLLSDRAAGHAVQVRLAPTCHLAGATPTTSRTPGVRSYLRLTSIDPRYAGTLYDVFPGGCVSYRFDLQRGPHIAVIQEFEQAVALVSRHRLRLQLHQKLGLDLNP